jgi:hypothetical protein
MNRAFTLPQKLSLASQRQTPELASALARLAVDTRSEERLLATLPFAGEDTTAGSETELQVAVAGRRKAVDLPLTIEESTYFENLLRRARSGDSSQRPIQELEQYLSSNQDQVWENSGVRFPYRLLQGFAREVFHFDLLADKQDPQSGLRSDSGRYLIGADKAETVRVPISYLIKLALADLVGRQEGLPRTIRQTGQDLMGHYLNDNTSPETFSFHVVPVRPDAGMGRALARETSKRFLLTR